MSSSLVPNTNKHHMAKSEDAAHVVWAIRYVRPVLSQWIVRNAGSSPAVVPMTSLYSITVITVDL